VHDKRMKKDKKGAQTDPTGKSKGNEQIAIRKEQMKKREERKK